MNEDPLSSMHGLDRFEQELRSLTPKSTSTVLFDPESSHANIRHSSGSPKANRYWLQTASVSWTMGLATGILISAFWTQSNNRELSPPEPNLVAQETTAPTTVASAPTPQNRPPVIHEGFLGTHHPVMHRNDPIWSFDGVLSNRSLSIAERRMIQTDHPSDSAHASTDAPPTPIPSSPSPSRSQRQLLQMLIKSEDLISI